MELFGLAVVFVYGVVSLIIGTRLLLLYRRSRRAPELLVGLAFFAGGVFGYPLNIAASVIWPSSPSLGLATYAVGQISMGCCAVVTLIAWPVVFARSSRVARLVAIGLSASIAVTLSLTLRYTVPDATRFTEPAYLADLSLRSCCFVITGAAIVRYARSLRRRVRIGLADPVVVARMYHWAVAEFAIFMQYVLVLGSVALASVGVRSVVGSNAISALGLIAGFSSYMSFLSRRAGVSAAPQGDGAGEAVRG